MPETYKWIYFFSKQEKETTVMGIKGLWDYRIMGCLCALQFSLRHNLILS